MTVKDVIEELQNLPQDSEVYIQEVVDKRKLQLASVVCLTHAVKIEEGFTFIKTSGVVIGIDKDYLAIKKIRKTKNQ